MSPSAACAIKFKIFALRLRDKISRPFRSGEWLNLNYAAPLRSGMSHSQKLAPRSSITKREQSDSHCLRHVAEHSHLHRAQLCSGDSPIRTALACNKAPRIRSAPRHYKTIYRAAKPSPHNRMAKRK
ncbi:hypothetical protein [uncultured Campylobacter sp.]|uniref:hypothetical protein n=1 Tax=uncultured Campylobacter sp. TaxID=218934 RepID=UPI0025DD19E1|nr:hypothetical protein [uncultured Campylobacter sp.]